LIIIVALTFPAQAQEWRGQVSAEYRGFAHAALDPGQHRGYASLVAQPEFRGEWQDGRQQLTFTGFYRWDQHDRQRTHGDVRELLWLYAERGVELRAGIGKTFWGVAETQNLVDVVNQVDLVEDPDRDEKLGQPMLGATLLTRAGNWELYFLPYFRERTFPGEEGRLRTFPRVDTGQDALYESSRGRRHVDAAGRWTRTFGAWDVGLSYFRGTNREPRLVPGLDAAGQPVLLPYYGQLRQLGLETQATLNRWLLKLEAVRRSERDASSRAATTGFEYTVPGAFGGASDLGLLAEYVYDSRGLHSVSGRRNAGCSLDCERRAGNPASGDDHPGPAHERARLQPRSKPAAPRKPHHQPGSARVPRKRTGRAPLQRAARRLRAAEAYLLLLSA
jgi:hypothetical protein